jgi:hypothetical protein
MRAYLLCLRIGIRQPVEFAKAERSICAPSLLIIAGRSAFAYFERLLFRAIGQICLSI